MWQRGFAPQRTKGRRAIRLPPGLGLNSIAHYRFEAPNRRRLEVNVAQYEAALCTKVEGLDYAHGDYGGCLWPREIGGGERHVIRLTLLGNTRIS